MMRIAVLAAGCAALALTPAAEAEAKSRYEASITRTTYGIPHIAADTWQGVGYGVAYAYAEDNLCGAGLSGGRQPFFRCVLPRDD